MIAVKLAVRNLIGAGLRTGLNVFILSFAFVVIIWHMGILDGWNRQARRDMIDWEIGGGQVWHEGYDPYDPFTLADAHARVPESFQSAREKGLVTPIFVAQASLYPEGRIQSVLLKGIDPRQTILKIPSDKLGMAAVEIPALIGTRMARSCQLRQGDRVTVRWRDAHGTFDANEVLIVGLFKTDVSTVDSGQLWVPLDRLQDMMQLPDQATFLVTARDANSTWQVPGWTFQGHDVLLEEMDRIISRKRVGGVIMDGLLVLLAMLAIFDTQVLTIFRRQKEIGTEMALGMTRGQVVRLFTIEGAMHSVLAVLVGAVYGIPLLWWMAVQGFPMPAGMDDYGLAIAERIFPVYSLGLVAGTTLLVLVTATVVSYLPARRITRMNPTDAIRGRLQ